MMLMVRRIAGLWWAAAAALVVVGRAGAGGNAVRRRRRRHHAEFIVRQRERLRAGNCGRSGSPAAEAHLAPIAADDIGDHRVGALLLGKPNSSSPVVALLARTTDGGRSWTDVTPAPARPRRAYFSWVRL
jgi:hypothetical protein